MKTLISPSRVFALAVALGVSLQSSVGQIPGAGTVDNNDDKFMRTASTVALMEVRLGALAQERRTRPEVQAYANQVSRSHSATNTALRELAGRKGVALPSDVDGSQQKVIDDLSKMTGTAFDDVFLETMARAHQKDADEYQNAASSSKDPGVKGFAQKMLPMVKAHLAKVKALQKRTP